MFVPWSVPPMASREMVVSVVNGNGKLGFFMRAKMNHDIFGAVLSACYSESAVALCFEAQVVIALSLSTEWDFFQI